MFQLVSFQSGSKLFLFPAALSKSWKRMLRATWEAKLWFVCKILTITTSILQSMGMPIISSPHAVRAPRWSSLWSCICLWLLYGRRRWYNVRHQRWWGLMTRCWKEIIICGARIIITTLHWRILIIWFPLRGSNLNIRRGLGSKEVSCSHLPSHACSQHCWTSTYLSTPSSSSS